MKRRFHILCWLTLSSAVMLGLFVNCSATGVGNVRFSNGGTGTDGMRYYSYGACTGSQVGIRSTASVSQDLQTVLLLRQNCQDLASPQAIPKSQVTFGLEDNSVFAFNGQVFDRQTGSSGQRITVELCRSSGVSPQVQASIWNDQGTSTTMFGRITDANGLDSGILTVQNPSATSPLDFMTASGQASGQFDLSLSSASAGTLTYALNGGASVSIPSMSCVAQSVPVTPILFSTGSVSYSTTASTVTIVTPPGLKSGDVMIAQVWGYFNSSCPNTVTPPAGWTQIRSDNAVDYGCLEQYLFYKVGTGSEPAQYTFSLQIVPTYLNAFGASIVAYSGAKASAPIDTHACGTGTSATATAPSITLTHANEMTVFSVFQSWSHGALPTTPSYLTQRIHDTDNSAYLNFVYDGTAANSGPTAPITESIASGNDWFACQIGLTPGP